MKREVECLHYRQKKGARLELTNLYIMLRSRFTLANANVRENMCYVFFYVSFFPFLSLFLFYLSVGLKTSNERLEIWKVYIYLFCALFLDIPVKESYYCCLQRKWSENIARQYIEIHIVYIDLILWFDLFSTQIFFSSSYALRFYGYTGFLLDIKNQGVSLIN